MLTMLDAYGMKKKLHRVEQYLDDYLHFEQPYISESALSALRAGGKRVRPTLVLMTAAMYGQEQLVVPLAAAMELIHMASLLHDDVIDCADTRRGQPTQNVTYGNRYALHTGDYVLTKAMEIIKSHRKHQQLLPIMAQLSIEMCLGEIEQLNSEYDTQQTLEDYYYRIDRKTALLMATSCQVGAIASDAPQEQVEIFYQIGYHLGMAFQIKDDTLDMEQNQKKLGKPAGSDLARGIMTLPTILVLQKQFPERELLLQLITDRFPRGQADVQQALDLIRQYGGMEQAAAYSSRYVDQAKAYIRQLPCHPIRKGLLAGADYIVERAF